MIVRNFINKTSWNSQRKRRPRARLVHVFKKWKLLFENFCENTCGWKSALKCVKCCLKTENGCLKTSTKHPPIVWKNLFHLFHFLPLPRTYYVFQKIYKIGNQNAFDHFSVTFAGKLFYIVPKNQNITHVDNQIRTKMKFPILTSYTMLWEAFTRMVLDVCKFSILIFLLFWVCSDTEPNLI